MKLDLSIQFIKKLTRHQIIDLIFLTSSDLIISVHILKMMINYIVDNDIKVCVASSDYLQNFCKEKYQEKH